MSRYSNGQIPSNLLVEVGPYHWLTAATAVRWRALVADVKKNEGITLRITPGKNAYRDRKGQEVARTNACARGRCNDAAVPGTSSHGGEYQGRDSMAIDVDNWAELGKDKWYAYCRKHGFEPGFFDWEPWHIIDWSPWAIPTPASGGGSVTIESEEGEMDFFNLHGKAGSHHAGTFAVYRSNSNKNLYAKRITKGKFASGAGIPTFDADALPELKSIFGKNFLDL